MVSNYFNKYGIRNDEYDVRERVRRRRRRLAAGRRMGNRAFYESEGVHQTTAIGAEAPEIPRGVVNVPRLPYRRRALLIILICAAIALTGYIGAYNNVKSDSGLAYTAHAAEETVYKDVTVHSGDTLWGIVSEFAEPSKDIRKQIKEICELNGVEPGGIYPGQVIIVPIPAHLA